MLHSCSGITLTEHMARASVQQGEKQGSCGAIHPYHTRRTEGPTRRKNGDIIQNHWVFGTFFRAFRLHAVNYVSFTSRGKSARRAGETRKKAKVRQNWRMRRVKFWYFYPGEKVRHNSPFLRKNQGFFCVFHFFRPPRARQKHIDGCPF